MSDKNPNKSVASVAILLILLSLLFTAVTVVQFIWIQQLKSSYDESQGKLSVLQTWCFKNATPDVVRTIKDKEEGGNDPQTRGKRQVSSSLTQMLTDMMTAQEKILLSHCLNNSKLCIPGPKGDLGFKGDTGSPGLPGIQGLQGLPGVKGNIGRDGLPGIKGNTGLKGDQGLPGIPGVKGNTGPKGEQGVPGLNGTAGIQGPKGDMGITGVKGDIGARGIMGINGTDGQQGAKGEIGLTGLKGEPGLQGPTGPPGVQLQKDCMCIKMPKIDVFQPSSPVVSYKLGSAVNLTCGSNSVPPPTVTWSTPTDRVCPGVNHTGSSLTVPSLQPSQLGKYDCTVTNQYGSSTKSVLIQSNVTGAVDCDFEGIINTCLWKNSLANNNNWLLHNGPTQTAGTGPSADHTLGGNSGHYMYIEGSVGMLGEIATIESPELPPNNGACLVVWYNMHGSDIGSLSVETKTCTGAINRLIKMSGDQGSEWKQAQFELPAMNKDHVIAITSTHGPGVLGDTAIDDIQYYPGKCISSLNLIGSQDVTIHAPVNQPLVLDCTAKGSPPPTFTWHKVGGCVSYNFTGERLAVANPVTVGDAGTYVCTATSGTANVSKTFHVEINNTDSNGGVIEDKCSFENGLCGWRQDLDTVNDKFDWTEHSGPTQSSDTGPDDDHTFGSANGKYMYIETSSPRQPGDYAILRSHLMRANHSACFSFYYTMFGVDTENLQVFVEDLCTHKQTLVFSKNGNQGANWNLASVSIKDMPHDYNILVRADVGSSYHGDTAIDDLMIKDDTCIASAIDCDFDKSLCSWRQSATDDIDWTRSTSTTESTNTGPLGDHTDPNGLGYYLYTEASNIALDAKADLISPMLQPGTDYCFHMVTNMYGDTMGSIIVKIESVAPNSKPVTLVKYNQNDQSPIWQPRDINIPAQMSNFTIIIEGKVGSNYASDAAIDDVSINTGTC